MTDPAGPLKNLVPEHDFFIGIDSDGCAFDSMEIKHKECFCPNFIKHFELQPVSKYAREVWDFVNLYSQTRGLNRFKALLRALELLAERPEVREREVEIPAMEGLKKWVGRESKLGNPALEEELKRNPDPDLQRAYEWSLAVNESVKDMVFNLPPFPALKKQIHLLPDQADIVVVSQTPMEALQREWQEHGIDRFVKVIAGQEMGKKSEHLAMATDDRYKDGRILMIGDAPGDLEAARKNRALFYPIIPGEEDKSWQRFFEEALERFLSGTYAGTYAEELENEFLSRLPDKPHWEG